ncbi:MAG: 30S ribosomal protein S9 [Flavobacteriales bacterium]|nr:30S ribosomal protein S9 [Flavobacteriales bacterium]HCA83661.1 30S ribosomal protein S9 [Flavobacteriales bacterium]HRE73782.1 30S ribosomal protein S9 [Flavobacteriales bacterium]HRJ35606.1 30S ribosomal protein S9 [Flavobacteriales bacterium]HRJ39152.1 30S ribosomal protein S9 [Flavobacteriales bacterium]
MEVINALGRRKAAVARVYLNSGKGTVTINNTDLKEYFPTAVLQYKINQSFLLTGTEGKYDVTVNVDGGGVNGQAEAIRLGIARALVELDETMKPALKAAGLMTRDPRMVERKKPGQKKARKRYQFSKR